MSIRVSSGMLLALMTVRGTAPLASSPAMIAGGSVITPNAPSRSMML